MTANAFAALIERQFEAAALGHDAMAEVLRDDIASVHAIVAGSISDRAKRHEELADYMRKIRDAEDDADRSTGSKIEAALHTIIDRINLHAEKLRAGESILPPAPQLDQPAVNTEAVANPPALALPTAAATEGHNDEPDVQP